MGIPGFGGWGFFCYQHWLFVATSLRRTLVQNIIGELLFKRR